VFFWAQIKHKKIKEKNVKQKLETRANEREKREE
jgi:hypothetical protein